MNPTFEYVEDYIEFIAGYKTVSGKALGLFEQIPSPISLARYDVNIVASLSDQTQQAKAYTDKQAELAVKIVEKYKKQLLQLPVPVVLPEKLEKFKLGIRSIDRSRRAIVCNDKIHLQFPFNTAMIDAVKAFARESQGRVEWNHDHKVWSIAVTEYNVNWVCAFAAANQFEIDEQLKLWLDLILQSENTDFKIELIKTHSGYTITNAPDSVTQYITERFGETVWTDVYKLADLSTVLGFSVSEDVAKALTASDIERELLLSKNIKWKTSEFEYLLETSILPYARQVNRLPVRIYSPGVPKKSTDEIEYLNGSSKIDHNQTIPLLISTNGIMIGSKRSAWLQNAEKTIIFE